MTPYRIKAKALSPQDTIGEALPFVQYVVVSGWRPFTYEEHRAATYQECVDWIAAMHRAQLEAQQFNAARSW